MEDTLKIFLGSDLFPWEKQALLPLFHRLGQDWKVEQVPVGHAQRNILGKNESGVVWIIARDWRSAVKFLGVKKQLKAKVFVSVMALSSPRENIYRVLLKKMVGSLPESVTLLVHSPLNYRFFTELEGFSHERVRFLPLSLPEMNTKKKEKTATAFSVGTFGPLMSDSHLNFVVSVAHYLVKKNDKIHFRMMGSGPLYQHASHMIRELSLTDHVTVVETVDPETVEELDVLLYSPLRNDHFLPLYFAGMAGVPVVATEVPGLTDFLKDGQSGFIVPINETKSMGELVLRLQQDKHLAASMASRLQESLLNSVSVSHLAGDYAKLFFQTSAGKKSSERAA